VILLMRLIKVSETSIKVMLRSVKITPKYATLAITVGANILQFLFEKMRHIGDGFRPALSHVLGGRYITACKMSGVIRLL
jgi:hypothetical protein